MYSISNLKSFNLAMRDFLYDTYDTEFPLGGPDSRVFRTTPPTKQFGWLRVYYSVFLEDSTQINLY